MSESQFEAGQLREEIERLKEHHKLELQDKDDQISELKATLKTKRRIEMSVHYEETSEFFTKGMMNLLNALSPNKTLSLLYRKISSFINFTIVCLMGLLAYRLATPRLSSFSPLIGSWIGGLLAIILVWDFTVGPLGYIMGLSPKRKVVKKGT